MVILNMFGKTRPILISSKLALVITNLDYNKEANEFILEELEDIVENPMYDELIENNLWLKKTTGNTRAEKVWKNLTEIYCHDLEISYIKLKNTFTTEPSLQIEYLYKFVEFCSSYCRQVVNIVPQKNRFYPLIAYPSAPVIPQNSYTVEMSFPFKTMLQSKFIYDAAACRHILRKSGKLIDNFLQTNNDFWLFDYLLEATFLLYLVLKQSKEQ